MGKKPSITDVQIAAYNLLQRNAYGQVGAQDRILFLPHCLRKAKKCRGENTEEGLVCKHCSPDCSINHLSAYARSKGLKCFIAPGGAMVFNIIEKYQPKGIIGVACHHEIAQAAERIGGKESGFDFTYQGVALSKSGCMDTQVDEKSVISVMDYGLSSPLPPVPKPSSRPSRWRLPAISGISPRKAGAFAASAASITVAIVALLMVLPQLIAPFSGMTGGGSPVLSFSSKPSSHFIRGADGNAYAEVRVVILNTGDATASGVLARTTASYCGRPYLPADGGEEVIRLNGSIKAGGSQEITTRVRVHTENDTAVRLDIILAGKTVLTESYRSVKNVFITNVGIIGYTSTIIGGREANISVQVYNDRTSRSTGSLRLLLESFTSFNKNTHTDSSETELQGQLVPGDVWSVNLLVNVNELDPGKPTFVVELYENNGASPTDSVMVEG